MRVNEFLRLVVETTRPRLAPRLRSFRTRYRFTLVQFYYTKRTIHYEVWVRGKERLIEIGLHCESDKETNSELLRYLDSRAFDIKEALGDRVEIEQWTASWTRAHQVMPYEKLDAATAEAAAQRLAQMIETLEPMLARAKPSGLRSVILSAAKNLSLHKPEILRRKGRSSE